MVKMRAVAFTIAGSDPSGGAGIQADLKTFHQFGVYGAAALALVTVQNTRGVSEVRVLEPALVEAQIHAVVDDLPVAAAKTGALGEPGVVEAVGRLARDFAFPLVVDPVMISKHGARLIAAEARQALIDYLLPACALVTPNLHEAAELAGMEVATIEQMKEAARRIAGRCGASVLVKGGHLAGDAVDVLLHQDHFELFGAPRTDTVHTHGTGCTYSAAITAGLALGLSLPEAVGRGKRFITAAIRTAPGLGGGCGPVNHFADMED
jgi:hydroxymethylpyrimidine/phosphomethylpyrimidine kinase